MQELFVVEAAVAVAVEVPQDFETFLATYFRLNKRIKAVTGNVTMVLIT